VVTLSAGACEYDSEIRRFWCCCEACSDHRITITSAERLWFHLKAHHTNAYQVNVRHFRRLASANQSWTAHRMSSCLWLRSRLAWNSSEGIESQRRIPAEAAKISPKIVQTIVDPKR
jgi:hypothetical protein